MSQPRPEAAGTGAGGTGPAGPWVFVGDSVTAAGRVVDRRDDLGRGWVADVARRLQLVDPDADVVNLGISGNRAAHVRDRVVDDMDAAGVLEPGVVLTLAAGINDVRRAHLDGERFDVRTFARTYAGVLPRVAAAVPGGRVRLLLVEPVLAPHDRDQQTWSDDLDDVCDYLGHLASAERAALVRVRQTFARADATEVTRDGIHPTRSGHRLLADAWWDTATGVPGLLPAAARDLPADVLAAGGPRWWDRLRTRLTGG